MKHIQDLLDTESVVGQLGFPVNAQAYSDAVDALRAATRAAEVCDAWNRIAGAIGPQLTAAILSCDDWRMIGQPTRPLDDYDSDDQSQAVWVSDSQKVMGHAQVDGKHLVAVVFSVEAR